jgi:hypothetical protein
LTESLFPLRHVASLSAISGRILAFGPNGRIAHDSSTFCAAGKDKSGTCAQTFRLLKLQGFACRLRSDVLVDLAANRAMLY